MMKMSMIRKISLMASAEKSVKHGRPEDSGRLFC